MKTPIIRRVPAEAGQVTPPSAQAGPPLAVRKSEAETVWQTEDALSPPMVMRPLRKGMQ